MKLNKAELEQKREQIRTRAKELIEQSKEARNAENWDLFEKLENELDILRRKQMYISSYFTVINHKSLKLIHVKDLQLQNLFMLTILGREIRTTLKKMDICG